MNPIMVIEENFGSTVRFHYLPDTDKFYAHGSDLAKVLQFTNPSDALSRNVFSEYRFKIAAGVGQPSWYLSEPGIYQLLFASKHPKAVEFQRWVFEEILPKLRASGAYIMPNATSEQLQAALNEIVALNDKVACSNRRALQWHEELDRFKLGHRTIRQFLHDCTTSFDKEGSGCLLYELYGVFRHWSNTMYMIKAVKPEHFKQMLHEMYGDPVIFDGDGRWPGLKIKSQYRSIASRSLPIKDLT